MCGTFHTNRMKIKAYVSKKLYSTPVTGLIRSTFINCTGYTDRISLRCQRLTSGRICLALVPEGLCGKQCFTALVINRASRKYAHPRGENNFVIHFTNKWPPLEYEDRSNSPSCIIIKSGKTLRNIYFNFNFVNFWT